MAGLLDAPDQGNGLLTRTYDIRGNLDAAHKTLRLTPQERALYERHLTNLWGTGGVDHPDGSRSSLYQMTVTGPDGRYYNIPTVYGGRILEPDVAVQRAASEGWKNFPAYDDADQAEARYQAMHKYIDRDTDAYMAVRRGPLQLGEQ